jgi:cytochrome bd-type quinol oxidase subunit 2
MGFWPGRRVRGQVLARQQSAAHILLFTVLCAALFAVLFTLSGMAARLARRKRTYHCIRCLSACSAPSSAAYSIAYSACLPLYWAALFFYSRNCPREPDRRFLRPFACPIRLVATQTICWLLTGATERTRHWWVCLTALFFLLAVCSHRLLLFGPSVGGRWRTDRTVICPNCPAGRFNPKLVLHSTP